MKKPVASRLELRRETILVLRRVVAGIRVTIDPRPFPTEDCPDTQRETSTGRNTNPPTAQVCV
jgi:hypothetical protein